MYVFSSVIRRNVKALEINSGLFVVVVFFHGLVFTGLVGSSRLMHSALNTNKTPLPVVKLSVSEPTRGTFFCF
jgi:hypothetical protein